MEIFKLVGSIMVDSADAESSIQKTSDKAEGLGNKLSSGIKTAGKWAAGIGAAAVAVGGAMVKAAKDTADTMDAIDKGSQRMKVTAERYQELSYAANLCGVEMSTMERAAKKLEGTDMSMDDAMKSIYALGTAEERSAKAAELFGESIAYQLTPMLNASGDEMDAMAKEAHDLGLVMSNETVSSGAELNDMFAKVESSMTALKTGLMSEFMPYIMEILDWVIQNIPQIRETVGKVMGAIMPIVKPILDAIMAMLPPLMDAIQTLIDWIMPYLEPVISAITDLVSGFISLMQGDFEGFINGLISFLNGVVSTFTQLGADIISGIWQGMKNIWGSVASWFQRKIDWLNDKLSIFRSGQAELASGTAAASGLPYVPYDNFPVMLHRGETVISRQEADKLREGGEGGGITINQYIEATPQTPVELAAATASYFENARWALA